MQKKKFNTTLTTVNRLYVMYVRAVRSFLNVLSVNHGPIVFFLFFSTTK